MPVSSEFLELMGEYKAAAREVGRELKDLTREAKDAAKAGGGLSAEKQGRLAYLESRRDSLNDRYQQQKNIDDAIKTSLSRQVDTARGKLADVMRIASGRVTARDVEALGSGARRVGASIFASATPGSAAASVGARMMQAGGAIAGTAAKMAGPAALIAATGLAAYKFADAMYERRANEGEAAGRASDALNAVLFQERFSERVTGQDIAAVRGGQASVSRRVRETAANASATEGLLSALGFGASDATLALQGKAMSQEQRRRLLGKHLGEPTEAALGLDQVREEFSKEIAREADKRTRGRLGWLGYARQGIGDLLLGTDERSLLELEAGLEIQRRQMDSIETQRKTEEEVFTATPEYRVEEQARNRQLRAVEEDRLRRRLQWNQW